ncbi:MAG: single-stranded DNA-binding protein [Armatimonadetes bacterium CG2_30_59_28]|nr:single-stranded DNA-binding protein [Armatimonadota bacterium]OIO98525.1 MAG: single-stranded DNA-binding protein [Armatimonadetes bacterium CG2_30_59_28]PIU63719.1 MAG: single-stranded DNA-binding protein [Armatimonadetes bacterium CG07_land_8_20_14_0_80_59_28]PIX40710.1 MAG: single-stranded DNA-binding protein [Armatimonadetes bacterium CG_4_8_14_3_um_filter_58_9]PIY43337.1 MAG: single-stranded DNA-binding protein [Armatimonadetes bacterium CG_4_10_14_3_um_filter_59_10]
MVNRIVLIGRLTRDPELRYTPSGLPVVNFTLAVDRNFKNAQGEKETDFVRCIAWRQRAEFVANYLTKGRLAAVDGRLQIREYTTQDGQRRTIAEVVADNVYGLDRPKEAAPGVEDIPPPDDTASGSAGGLGDEFDGTDPFADE